jgi:hypothetical protein
MELNNKNQKTLQDIFENPIKASIPWTAVEGLFLALGAEVTEGSGSRVRIALNGVRSVFHRPHPEKEVDKGAVKSIRRFLLEAGVNSDEI